MTGTRAVLATVVTVLGLGVAACGGEDPEPNVAPSAPSSSSAPSAPPSTTGTAVDTPPEMPDEASQQTQPGAERFVHYWFDALSFGMTTGETGTVSKASDAECGSCQALIRQIDELYAKGGRVQTAGWSVAVLTPNGNFDIAAPSFLLRVKQARRTLLEGAEVIDRTPPAQVPMHVRLASKSGSWVVADLEIIE